MSTDGQGTKRRRNTAEIFNPLSRAHQRYRLQTITRTGDSIANVSSRSLKIVKTFVLVDCIKF